MLVSTLKYLLRARTKKPSAASVTDFRVANARPGFNDIAVPACVDGNPLLDYFVANSGHVIHKWIHYFDVYHRVLDRYRGQPVKLLEIGVQNGGSARMWRHYLGSAAQIIGVDVDPQCKDLEAEGIEVWIGDQSDPDFWRRFIDQHGEIDIVIDDGGHTMVQQIVTFEALFPALANGGTYLCEDTHTSYFPAYGGGNKRIGTFHEYAKGLVDEMHAWYHAPVSALTTRSFAHNLSSLSFYDSIVVMEKRQKNPPLALARGTEGHKNVPPAMTYLDLRRFSGVGDAGVEDF